MPKMPLPPAESIRLEALAEVARGGMGSVELARAVDGRLAGQILAVKRLHPNIAEDPEFVSMFLDEAWMTAALKHPNVAQVVAWGNDDKGMFLAIELVQGVSLSRLLKEAQQNQEAFAERTVAFICSQLCAGLVAAHTLKAPDGSPLGLVHRDLTPANVLIRFDGLVKIIDFGIAKAEERISHTRTGQLKGKPAYMAPEQQRGGHVDARADLFAFGVLMFEMLAGRRPWTAKGAFDVMMEISNDPHPDLGELRRGLNPAFVAIAHKCLEKKAEDRFETAAEIKARLDTWLAAKGFSAGDQQSLAQFVLRNSQPQVLWWQEALRGEHSKKKAPTFKELEENIDEERARKAKAARKPTPPPVPNKGTVPMRAYPEGGSPESAPISSGQPLPPSSGSRGGVVVGAGEPARSFGSGQYAAQRPSGSGQYAAQQPPGSGQYATQQPPGSGQHLAQSVSSSAAGRYAYTAGEPAKLPMQPAPPAGAKAVGGTELFLPQSPSLHSSLETSVPFPASQRSPSSTSQPGLRPMTPVPAMLAKTVTDPGLIPTALAVLPTASMVLPAPPSPLTSPQSSRRSRAPLVLALLVLLLGGAFAGLWFFGDRLGLSVRDALRPAPAKAP